MMKRISSQCITVVVYETYDFTLILGTSTLTNSTLPPILVFVNAHDAARGVGNHEFA